MTKNLDAIYENGAFRPVDNSDVSLSDGTRVRISVVPIGEAGTADVLELAAAVYSGLSDEDVRDIETIAKDRSRFFSP